MPNFQIPPFAHLTYSDAQGSNRGYYATNQILRFRTSGPISCAWKKPEEKKDVRHGRRPADVRSQLVGDEQIGTASKANKAEV